MNPQRPYVCPSIIGIDIIVDPRMEPGTAPIKLDEHTWQISQQSYDELKRHKDVTVIPEDV